MMQFSANLSVLFTEFPFLDRFEAAARFGFQTVECQFPYNYTPRMIRERLGRDKLVLDLFNLPPGDVDRGDRGLACDPRRTDEFRRSVDLGLEYALALGTRKLTCLLGRRDASFSWAEQYAQAASNLAWAAAQLAADDMTLHIEPLNPADNPSYFLTTLALAESLLADVDCSNLRLQFDTYHVQRTVGDVVNNLRRHFAHLGHVQIADSPDRGEPGSGELNFPFILNELDRLGYRGRVGLEYIPTVRTTESLGWIARYGWHVHG